MEGRVLDGGLAASGHPGGQGRARPAPPETHPVGARVGIRELVERERLADAPAKLVEHELELGWEQPLVALAIARGSLDAPMATLASPRAQAAA